MAHLDDLVAEIPDPALREQLAAEVKRLKEQRTFGLVFEQHIPETVALKGPTVRVGSIVRLRTEPSTSVNLVVDVMHGAKATTRNEVTGEAEDVLVGDLLVVRRVGEPIYPTLTRVGSVDRAATDRPEHSVVNAENFHALQLFTYLYEGKVDCIYIDPPYNTGARDWKYNNRYVDDNDSWRHSKWLSMMQRRLVLAKRLLKPDGVLIAAIDEHEVHHLGMLLESIFPSYKRYMITVVNNPKGTYKQNFGRVDEQLLFCVPDLGYDVITPHPATSDERDDDEQLRLIAKLISLLGDDPDSLVASGLIDAVDAALIDEARESDEDDDELELAEAADDSPNYEHWFLRRRGQDSSYRHQRWRSFYAIYVDEDSRAVVGLGPEVGPDEPYEPYQAGTVVGVYPIDEEGHERVWRYTRATMQRHIENGEIVVGRRNLETGVWTLNHRKLKKDRKRHKTVWWDPAHDSGTHGTNLVNRLLGERKLFPFPKSVYAVRDALATVVRDRHDALIVDFFAGSGTTLHATAMLNAADGGRRRSIMVTNNEVSEKEATALNEHGAYPGDADYEARGIFELVTRPRACAAISGVRGDGIPLSGKYRDGRYLADGYEERVGFYRIDFLDPDDVDLGRQFEAIHPLLWMIAGSVGPHPEPLAKKHPFVLPEGCAYGVLLHEGRFRQFRDAVAKRDDLTHIWLVTDSEAAFAEMRAKLPHSIEVSMLYRDYLRNFQINTQALS